VGASAPPRSDRGYVTPDAVALDLEVATIGSRGIAYLLDLLLFAVVFLLLSLVQLALVGGGWFDSGLGVAVALVLAFVWQFGYPIAFETLWRGRTLGKAAMGLRVVTVEGAPVGVRHATIRAVTAPVEVLLTTGLVASIASFVSPRAQRLGDLAAGTLVVRERGIAPEPTATSFAPPPGAAAYVAQVDVSALGPREYALVRDTLRRQAELSPEAGWQLSWEVAEAVAPLVRPLPPAGTAPAAFLQAVAAAVQQRAPRQAAHPRQARSAGAHRAAGGALGLGPTCAAARPPPRPAPPPPHEGPGFTAPR
jgi:uncharacterized RDD family membrane protein YckC